VTVKMRVEDMPLPLQRRAVRIAAEAVAAMPKLESKRLALKKVYQHTNRVVFFFLHDELLVADLSSPNQMTR
jgi:hypothetical protein